MTLLLIGSLIGGVGLFLLGMKLMTNGLKFAAGKALRNILEHSIKTRIRAVMHVRQFVVLRDLISYMRL